MNEKDKEPIIIALPRGRILRELIPLLAKINIIPEKNFFNDEYRLMRFKTSNRNIDLVRCRAFDVSTFVAFGGVDMGICGSDILKELEPRGVLSPLDLNIGKCRLSLIGSSDFDKESLSNLSHAQVATKYPILTRRFFEKLQINANCIKLNGAIELAIETGLCPMIVDLVSTGATLKAHGLKEIAKITSISSQLIVNRASLKLKTESVRSIINEFSKQIKN